MASGLREDGQLHLGSESSIELLPLTHSKHVVSEFMLKLNKKTKGRSDQVCSIVCCESHIFVIKCW